MGPELNSYIYDKLVFLDGRQDNSIEGDSLLNNSACWKYWICTVQNN